MVPLFTLQEQSPLYNARLYVPSKYASVFIRMAYDSNHERHFKSAKTISRFSIYNQAQIERGQVYVNVCVTCQQFKEPSQTKLTDPQILEMPNRRLRSMALDNVLNTPKGRDVYNAIKTWVYLLTEKLLSLKEGSWKILRVSIHFQHIFEPLSQTMLYG